MIKLKSERISFRCTPSVKQELNNLAHSHNINLSDLCLKLLNIGLTFVSKQHISLSNATFDNLEQLNVNLQTRLTSVEHNLTELTNNQSVFKESLLDLTAKVNNVISKNFFVGGEHSLTTAKETMNEVVEGDNMSDLIEQCGTGIEFTSITPNTNLVKHKLHEIVEPYLNNEFDIVQQTNNGSENPLANPLNIVKPSFTDVEHELHKSTSDNIQPNDSTNSKVILSGNISTTTSPSVVEEDSSSEEVELDEVVEKLTTSQLAKFPSGCCSDFEKLSLIQQIKSALLKSSSYKELIDVMQGARGFAKTMAEWVLDNILTPEEQERIYRIAYS